MHFNICKRICVFGKETCVREVAIVKSQIVFGWIARGVWKFSFESQKESKGAQEPKSQSWCIFLVLKFGQISWGFGLDVENILEFWHLNSCKMECIKCVKHNGASQSCRVVEWNAPKLHKYYGLIHFIQIFKELSRLQIRIKIDNFHF
jgi:hypothetical protein